nr:unnamed protein product [Haemonchus contortus]
MLSVTTKFSSVKGCFRVLPIRRLCSATSKPRKRKTVAGSRITSETLPHTAQADSPPDTVKSLAVGKKLLNTAESVVTASNMESTSVPSKKLPLRVTKEESSKASPIISSAELSSILSLDEPEQVSSHPTLKFVDFSIPTEEVDFSNVVNPSRYLSALRLCHKFSHGCALIRLHLATLNGPTVLEAARLLAAAQLRHRCALHSQPSENTYMHDVDVLSHELSKRFKSTSLPQSMAVAVNVLLGCVMDPSRTVSEISVEEMKQMIFRSEVHHHLACAALDCNQWEKFKCIMSSGPLSPHYSPILVFHMINFVLRNADLQKEVLKWYLDALSIEHKPLNQLQWSTYAANMIRVCGMKSVTATVTRKGTIGNGNNQQLSLRKEEPFTQEDFSCLKRDLNTLLGQLSKGSGSVTRKEVFALRKSINSWSKRYDDRAIVIDSLNVFHGRTTAFESLVKLTNRLTSEYDNAVLVTRPFLAEKLKFIRWRENVHVFSCSTL